MKQTQDKLQTIEDELLFNLAISAQDLATKAKSYPPSSTEHKRIHNELSKILHELAKNIFKSKRLKRPYNAIVSSREYQDIWNEALNVTVAEVCRKISEYRADYPVLAWVNKILPFRFSDIVKRRYPHGIVKSLDNLDEVLLSKDKQKLVSNSIPRMEGEVLSDGQRLRRFIHDDPQKRLGKHIRKRPKATFQYLLLAKIEGKTLDDISKELGDPPIPKTTLSSFFNAQFRNLKEYLQNSLSE
ncbi:MAG: hypothetical protein AAF959_01140 [Cyanobacteria bacterium P01_D01_bin.56]